MREKQFNRFHLTLSQNVLPKFTQETIDILTDEKKKAVKSPLTKKKERNMSSNIFTKEKSKDQ